MLVYLGGPIKGLLYEDARAWRDAVSVNLQIMYGINTIISIGTMVELGWASAAGIPVLLVMPTGNVHDHPFTRALCNYRVSTIEEASDLIGALL